MGSQESTNTQSQVVRMKPLCRPVSSLSSKFETEITHIDEIQDVPVEKIVELDVSEVVKKPLHHFYSSKP